MPLLLCWVAGPAFAARVELTMDSTSVQMGESIGVTVSVVDGTPTAVPRISTPPELNVQYVQQVSSSYWVNGRSTRTVKYRYQLTPAAAGDFVLGPAMVEMGTEKAVTGVLEVEVGDRPKGEELPVKVEAGFFPEVAYEGQVVVYKYVLESKIPLLGSRWSLPQTTGLSSFETGKTGRDAYVKQRNGAETSVDATYVPLVATTASTKQEFAAPVVQVDLPSDRERPKGRIPDFFQVYETRHELFVGETSHLEVLPLPPPPKGFSGLVGDFSFEGKLSASKGEVGRSTQWTVTVLGDGSLEGFALPPWVSDKNVRAYDAAPEISGKTGEKYQVQGSYVRTMVPTRSGTLQIPPLTIVTFSPKKHKYVTHTLTVPALTVSGSDESATVSSFRTDEPTVEEAPDDISPVRASGEATWARWPGVIGWLSGLFSMVVGFVVALELRDFWRARRKVPVEVPKAPDVSNLPVDPVERWRRLDEALRWSMAGPRFVDRESSLQAVESSLAAKVRDLWRRLDEARFAGRLDEDLEASVLLFLRERR